jgi:hypothetical protein
MKHVERRAPDIWVKLLPTHPEEWLRILRSLNIDPEGDDSRKTDDDPVPQALLKTMYQNDLGPLFEALKRYMPNNRTKHFRRNLDHARNAINVHIKEVGSCSLRGASCNSRRIRVFSEVSGNSSRCPLGG